jgi:hypothetical protein
MILFNAVDAVDEKRIGTRRLDFHQQVHERGIRKAIRGSEACPPPAIKAVGFEEEDWAPLKLRV